MFFLKYSDKLIFLSGESVNIASGYFNFDKSKIEIFPNGVDEIFHLKGSTNVKSVTDKLRIVFTGKISRKEKGFEFLKESLLMCEINFELYLAGNSGTSGIKDFINIPFMDTYAFADFLSDKHVFISASEYEPFSLSAGEAMAAGLVPVVTKQTGMSRFIENRVNGFVFEYGDSEKLAEILSGLFFNKEKLYECRDKSGEIYSQLNWQRVFNKYKNLYLNILNLKPISQN